MLLAEDIQLCHRSFARPDWTYRDLPGPLQREKQNIVLLVCPEAADTTHSRAVGAGAGELCPCRSGERRRGGPLPGDASGDGVQLSRRAPRV